MLIYLFDYCQRLAGRLQARDMSLTNQGAAYNQQFDRNCPTLGRIAFDYARILIFREGERIKVGH